MSKVKVELLAARAGDNFSQNVGEIVEVDAKEAERMIAAEQAVPVRGSKGGKAEKATAR